MMIGKRIKEVRKVLGLSQSAFAKALGIGITTLKDYERDKFYPKTEVVIKLKELFNINPNWLLTGEGEMFGSSEGGEYYNSAVGTGSQVLNVGGITGKTVVINKTEKAYIPENTDQNIKEILAILEEMKKQNPQAYKKAVYKLNQEAKALKKLLL